MKCNTCGNENVDGARFCATCGGGLAAAEPIENTLVGQTVGGRYHVKRVLGEGGMGVVYEAEQQMGNATRKVALKTLHAHLSNDPSVSQRFHRECGTIAQLEHPNTIKVYDFGTTADGTLYIAMEFVAGQSLGQLIEENKTIAPERVARIIRQIAGSLDEAHSQGVIHRDLKPDNVVLTQRAGEKDVVKLLDFGIAARTESADAQREQKLTQQGMVLGTPPYMSPEQFTGKALDARSDIYSLGVMTYEMLTGRLPFDATTPWQWATEHMTAQPIPFEATPISSQIPAAMRAAVLRALAKNREERQSSAGQFAEEISGNGAISEGTPAAVAPSTGTALMAAPPVFGGAPGSAPAKTAAMPSPISPSAASPVSGMAAAMPPQRGPSGNKGLVIGLASVGGLLVIGIAAVALKPKPSTDPAAMGAASASPVAPATVAPAVENTEVAPLVSAAPDPIPTPLPTTPTPSHYAPAAKPTTPAVPSPSPKAAVPPPLASGCAACLTAARSGNYPAAVYAYRSCADAAQKATCASYVRGRAPDAAKAAAFNGNCSQAKAIAAAGQGMGLSAGVFSQPLASCK